MKNHSWKVVFFWIISSPSLSCQNHKLNSDNPLAYEENDLTYINLYFDEIHDLKTKDFDNTILVFISGNCGSCTEKTVRFMNSMGTDIAFERYEKIIVLPVNSADVADSLNRDKLNIIIDDNNTMAKYGVHFGKNLFIEFKNGEATL